MIGPGVVIAEKYRIDRLLGEGGMGSVWVATNLVLEKRVALKVMGDAYSTRSEWKQRFFREGVAASRARHPGIVEVYDAGEHEGAPWMAMELLDGESLRERLERQRRLAPEEAVRIVTEALDALGAVHAVGIIHRDLKPDNLFLERTPKGERVKVLDFGIAKETAAVNALTAADAIIGTAHYLAPEQAKASRHVEPRTDLYAIGVILFECLSGAMPYEAATVPELIAKLYSEAPRDLGTLAPHVPQELVRVVHACLAKDPAARPSDAHALARALEGAMGRGATGPMSSPPSAWARAGIPPTAGHAPSYGAVGGHTALLDPSTSPPGASTPITAPAVTSPPVGNAGMPGPSPSGAASSPGASSPSTSPIAQWPTPSPAMPNAGFSSAPGSAALSNAALSNAALSNAALSNPGTPHAATPHAATPHAAMPSAASPPKRVWPWVVAVLLIVGVVVLVPIAMVIGLGMMAGVAYQQSARAGGGGFGGGALDFDLPHSPHVMMIADADGDGDEDVVGSIMRFSASSDPTSHFAAYDGESGRRIWISESLGTVESRASSVTAIADDAILLATSTGELRAFGLRDGRPRWHFNVGERPERFCASDPGGAILVTVDGRRTRVALTDGSARPDPGEACPRLMNDAVDAFWPHRIAEPPWTSQRDWDADVEGMSVEAIWSDGERTFAVGERATGTHVPIAAMVGRWQVDVPGVAPLLAEDDAPTAVFLASEEAFLAYTMENDAPARVTAIRLADGTRVFDAELTPSNVDPGFIQVRRDLVVVGSGSHVDVFTRADGTRRFHLGR
ncbi:MAG: protein kinase [Sandaracinaceae bacterium]